MKRSPQISERSGKRIFRVPITWIADRKPVATGAVPLIRRPHLASARRKLRPPLRFLRARRLTGHSMARDCHTHSPGRDVGNSLTARPTKSGGFTLTELMVVIATLTILAAILFPAVAGTKLRTHLTECFDNQRQLALGWRMYADDNNDKLISMNDGFSSDWRVRPGNAHWIQPFPTTFPSARAANRFWDQHGYRLGGLYRYAANPLVIHCPADTRNEKSARYAYTSYTGAAGLRYTRTHALSKSSQLLHPADRFLWTEENDPRSMTVSSYPIWENLGDWALPTSPHFPDPSTGFTTDTGGNPMKWSDSPAAFHGDSAVFSFADGHVENHRWVNEGTFKYISNPPAYRADPTVNSFTANPDDLYWVSSKYPSAFWP